MPTNKHAIIRYHVLDRCFSDVYKHYFVEDLIEACNKALYEYDGSKGISRRQIFDDINFMEDSSLSRENNEDVDAKILFLGKTPKSGIC